MANDAGRGTGREGLVYDIDQVRQDARSSVERGPVTPDYPLDLRRAHELLNEALASEILCVLRYRHHQIVAKGIDWPQVAEQFEEHADSEQEHVLMIATRIDQLGGDPDLDPASITARSATQYGPVLGGSLGEMIREDLVAERVVIEIYRKLIAWFGEADPTTRRMFERILENEEEHAADLADLLGAVSEQGHPAP